MDAAEARRLYFTWALVALGLSEIIIKTLPALRANPAMADQFDQTLNEVLADGRNTGFPEGIAIEDEAHAVRHALRELEKLVAEFRRHLREGDGAAVDHGE